MSGLCSPLPGSGFPLSGMSRGGISVLLISLCAWEGGVGQLEPGSLFLPGQTILGKALGVAMRGGIREIICRC